MKILKRILQRLDQMEQYSEHPDYLFRPFCSLSARHLYLEIERWAQADGLDYSMDGLANIHLKSQKYNASKPTLLFGSHLDTVVNAGKYDGPLGFLMAYELLKYSIYEAPDLPFNIEVIGFSDEEGVRYQTAYLGSSSLAGSFQEEWLDRKDADGIAMRDALAVFGCNLSNAKYSIDPANYLGYYEIHIEQGPVLQTNNCSVGVVRNIYGQLRIAFEIIGFAGHAGTVPMHLRQDALAGLAQFAIQLEAYGIAQKEDLVATIGQCEVLPGASNVIPGKVRATIDIRSHNLPILEKAGRDIEQLLHGVGRARNLKTKWTEVQRNLPVHCDSQLTNLLKASVEAYSGNCLVLSSGAGHDSVPLSNVIPVCMLFVRCRDGISHNPLEHVEAEDIDVAWKVSVNFLHQLQQQYQL